MPITPFLARQAFEPETIRDMSTVLMDVCSRLGIVDFSHDETEAVAKVIIGLAQRGVRDPAMLRKMTLMALNVMPPPDGPPVAPVIAPHCPACGAQMRLVLLDPAFPPEPEKHVYQCPVCGVFETAVVDPKTGQIRKIRNSN